MHHLRNLFCLLVICFVGGILFLNSEWSRSVIKEKVQQEVKQATGLEVKIGNLEFDFPRSIVMSDVAIFDGTYGSFHGEKFVFTGSLFKAVFGRLSEGLITVKGLSTSNTTPIPLPENVQAYLSWGLENYLLEGEIEQLECSHAEMPYHITESAPFKLSLAGLLSPEKDSTYFECLLSEIFMANSTLKGVACYTEWNNIKNKAYFFLSAEEVSSPNLFGRELDFHGKDLRLDGKWALSAKEANYTLRVEDVALKSDVSDSIALHASHSKAKGWHNFIKEEGRLTLKFKHLFDQNLLWSDSMTEVIGLACSAEWSKGWTSAQLMASAEEILEEHFSLAQTSLTVNSQGPGSWKYTLSSQGVYEDPFLGDIAGIFFLKKDSVDFTLNSLKATWGDHLLKLNGTAKGKLDYKENLNLEIPACRLSFDNQIFQLQSKANKETIDLALEMPRQPFNYIEKNSKWPSFKAFSSGIFSLKGPFSDPRASLNFNIEGMSIQHAVVDPAALFNLNLKSEYEGGFIAVNCSLKDRNMPLVKLQGKLPVEQQGLFTLVPSKEREMNLQLAGSFDLSPYLYHSIPPNLWITGQSALDIRLTGPYRKPNLVGHIKLINGNFECWETGTRFYNINADFDLTHEKIFLHSSKAFDMQGGAVTAFGEMDLTSALDFPFHIDFSVKRAAVADLDEALLMVSGGLSFIGNRKGATLKGELNAEKLDIALTDNSPTLNHNIEPIYINQSVHEPRPTLPSKSTMSWPVCFDVHLINNGSISIHSKELTSQWKGDVRVKGCNSQPLVYGDFKVLKGEFNLPDYLFPGKKFKLSQGAINFAGDFFKKTTLYVVGEMEIEHILAQVILKGPLNDPSLAFRSNPPLSQNEILSWILFGQGMNDIDSFQGAELTQSLNKLKKGKGSNSNSSILSGLTRLKESLGLDRIGIDRTNSKNDKEEVSVRVGKYILPQVCFSAKRNITSEANGIGLEANISKNLKLHAEVGDDKDNQLRFKDGQLHLKWKHDY